jgi:PAS domain S-box-containing protein
MTHSDSDSMLVQKLSTLSQTLNILKEGVCLLDKDLRIVYINRSAREIFKQHLGVIPDIGQNYMDYVDEGRKDLTRQYIDKVFQGIPVTFEIYYPQENKDFWFELSYCPIINEDNLVTHVCAKAEEITKQVKLKRKLGRQQRLKKDALSKAINEAQEKERQLIGRELHDNINQVLTTIKLYNEICLGEEQTNKGLLLKSVQQLNLVIGEIRNISHRLLSPELSNQKFILLMRKLAESVSVSKHMQVSFFAYGLGEKKISTEIQTALYRVAQEQMTNILKHAGASQVEFFLVGTSDQLALSIIDDGKGFDLSEKTPGSGMSGMRSRIESLNGHLEIETLPGKGCKIMIEIPYIGPRTSSGSHRNEDIFSS